MQWHVIMWRLGRWLSFGVKLVFIAVIVMVLCWIYAGLKIWYDDENALNSQDKELFNEYFGYLKNVQMSGKCIIPNPDPFDPSIRAYLQRDVPRLNCDRHQPYLTSLDQTGHLVFNVSARVKNVDDIRLISCDYSEIRLKDDHSLVYSKPKTFGATGDAPQIHSSDTVHVKCYDSRRWIGGKVYENVHTYVKLQTPVAKISDVQTPNVLILVLDSQSRSNVIRQLKKSYKFLTKSLRATVFRGLNKVGENTFPNLIPLLTGLRVSWSDESLNELPVPYRDLEKTYVDDFPFVWKIFKEKGYKTIIAEDMPRYSLFNYVPRGFRKKPVDHYMRPFWLAMEESGVFDNSFCFGNEGFHQILLNYASEFALKYRKASYFGFVSIGDIGHNDINLIGAVDDDLVDFLGNFNSSGDLENTVLIVMGDHGNRISAIRSTYVGRLEDRMPFFSIRLPQWMHSKYPHLRTNLEVNSRRLTSWFDVHELLQDIARGTFAQSENRSAASKYGLSLFRQIVPENRTCVDAGIAEEYCVCNREVPVKTSTADDVSIMSQFIVDQINKQLEPFSEQCAQLSLEKILGASMVLPVSKTVAYSRRLSITFRLTFEVSPSGGKFEAVVKKHPGSRYSIAGDINRINRYGDQPACLPVSSAVRSMCYCLTEVTKS